MRTREEQGYDGRPQTSLQAKINSGLVVQDLVMPDQGTQNEVSYLGEKRTRLIERT